MVDRLKFYASVGQVVFPFAMMPLSDSPSPSCAAFITQQQQQLRAQSQQQQQQQQQQQLHPQQRFPMPGQYQQPPKPLQQPTIPAHHHQQQQQQQQLPPSLPQQQQPMQSPNFYLQQQQQQQQPPPPPQSQGITATRPTGATMPQGPTDAAAQPRLMPHPISSYSSMKQGAPGSSGPPLTMASAGYSNGMPSAPPRQQPQFAPQGGYAAPQQNY
ncbi:protein transport protein Sec31, putative, partial [Trypanosoma cruzi marinkellei]